MKNFIRSSLFYLGLIPLTVIYSFISILILPLNRPARYKIITGWARACLTWLKFTCNLSWVVEGAENITQNSGVIICKHQSAWETISLQLIFPRQSQVIKRELIWIPFFGWGLASLNPIAINRKSSVRSLKSVLMKGEERIKQGWWVLIFPEGTRIPVGEVGQYKQTGAALARQLGCPLIPVAHNAGAFWPRKSFQKKEGMIRVVVGKPISTHNKTTKEITEEAKIWIESTCAKLPRS